VSYYGCSIPRLDDPTTTGAPALILLGELDRNVSVARTELIAEDLRRGGSAVDLRILPKVYHQWDGADVTQRFVRFNLRRFAFRLDKDSEAFDEKSGMRVRGPLSRTWAILRRADPRGYHILRDEAAIARTDELMLSFLARAGAAQADAGPGSGATRARRSAVRSRATTV
jgi:dienelactone hydrolase